MSSSARLIELEGRHQATCRRMMHAGDKEATVTLIAGLIPLLGDAKYVRQPHAASVT